MNKKNIYLKLKYYIVLGISFWILLSSIFQCYLYVTDSLKTKKLLKEINNVTVFESKDNDNNLVNPPNNEKDTYWYYKNTDFLEVDLDDLIKENSDTVAWIKVEGTDINEVVVQSKDNSYYLQHSFNKTKNTSGWIFSDYRNNLDYFNFNSIIYGHTLKDKTMFSSLKNLLENEWFKNKDNHIIKLSTKNYNTIWQIFSVYTINEENYYLKTNFSNMDEFNEFINIISKRSIYNFETSLNTDDRILTLSTCKGSSNNRIVVHAKLIKKEIK